MNISHVVDKFQRTTFGALGDQSGLRPGCLAATSMGFTVDLFARHPIPFEQLWQRSVLMDLGDTKVRVCSIDDLIEMKRQAGRHKDLADIEQLIKIKALTKEQSNDKND
jgi:hypothetical protein